MAGDKIKALRGNKILIFIVILCAIAFSFEVSPKKTATQPRNATATMKINLQSPDIVLTQNHEIKTIEIEENRLSGVVKFGGRIKTISFVAPGDAEMWFITPKGYVIIYLKNGEDVFFEQGKTFPSRAFRIRGQKGTATIQAWT